MSFEEVKKAIVSELKGETKSKILDIIVEEFIPIAQDYMEINPPFEGEGSPSLNDTVKSFRELLSTQYDSNIIVTNDEISIGFADKRSLGAGVVDVSRAEGLEWVNFYISGHRNRKVFLDLELISDMIREGDIQELDLFRFERTVDGYMDDNSVIKFGKGVLLDIDRFEQDGWPEILPDSELGRITGGIEKDFMFITNALSKINKENTVGKGIEKAMSGIK